MSPIDQKQRVPVVRGRYISADLEKIVSAQLQLAYLSATQFHDFGDNGKSEYVAQGKRRRMALVSRERRQGGSPVAKRLFIEIEQSPQLSLGKTHDSFPGIKPTNVSPDRNQPVVDNGLIEAVCDQTCDSHR